MSEGWKDSLVTDMVKECELEQGCCGCSDIGWQAQQAVCCTSEHEKDWGASAREYDPALSEVALRVLSIQPRSHIHSK